MSSIENTNSTDASVDIATAGDVVFIVGPSQRRLKVYSLLVQNASAVFNVMLGPAFKEGHQLAQPGLTEILLPEDNADAMQIVFNIMHGRNDAVSETLDAGMLLQVTITADKYDCYVPLKFAMKAWLDRMSTTHPEEAWTLAMTAIVLRRQESFAEATSALILNHSGSYLGLTKLYKELPDQSVQLRLAAMLEEARNRLRIKLFEDTLSGDWQCGQSRSKPRHRPDWLIEFMRRVGSLDQRSISSILDSLSHDDLPPHGDWEVFSSTNMISIFQAIAHGCKEHHRNEGGLCLMCTMTGDAHGGHG